MHPGPFRAAMEGVRVGWLLRRLLILAAPFVWRKFMERRRKQGAA